MKHYGRWRIQWVDQNRKRHSEVRDTYSDAEFMLRKHQTEVEEIKRGLKVPTASPKTVNDICDYWLEKRVPLKRSPKGDRDNSKGFHSPTRTPLQFFLCPK